MALIIAPTDCGESFFWKRASAASRVANQATMPTATPPAKGRASSFAHAEQTRRVRRADGRGPCDDEGGVQRRDAEAEQGAPDVGRRPTAESLSVVVVAPLRWAKQEIGAEARQQETGEQPRHWQKQRVAMENGGDAEEREPRVDALGDGRPDRDEEAGSRLVVQPLGQHDDGDGPRDGHRPDEAQHQADQQGGDHVR